MIYLSAEELRYVGERAIGAPLIVRDAGLIEAASARPQATWLGRDSYASIDEKAAALVHSLVSNHALVDGNKRLALASLIAFLGVNGWRLNWTNDDAYDFIVELATGQLSGISEIAERIAGARAARGSVG